MKASCEYKRKILESAGSKFFYVEFLKKDKTIRHMTCKKYMEKAFTNGSKNAAPSPFANKPEYFLAVDVAKEEFRAINLNNLLSCKVNGVSYAFESEENK